MLLGCSKLRCCVLVGSLLSCKGLQQTWKNDCDSAVQHNSSGFTVTTGNKCCAVEHDCAIDPGLPLKERHM